MYYFSEPGVVNTEKTFELAIKRAEEANIEYIVISSSTGETAAKLKALNPKQKIICVTQQAGFNGPGETDMSMEMREELESIGVKVLCTTHGFAGIDRALRFKFNGVYPAEIIASTLRIFGQGMKVAIEVSFMALDAALIPHGKPVIAMGGTHKGVDTAIILTPAHSFNFFDTSISEIICMPGGI